MIAKLRRTIVLGGAGLLSALPALAADPHASDAAHGAEASPGSALFSVDPGLMIWTIVTFVLVLIVLARTAWNPLIKSLQEREENISGAIESAQRVKNEAEALFAKYQTTLDQAKDESRSILEEARRDGTVVQEEIRKRALQDAEEFKQRARREIELAKDSALKEIWDEAASLSTELATRILGRSLNESDQDRLVGELIEDMRREMAAKAAVGQGSESA